MRKWANRYVDILPFADKSATYLLKRVGHTMRNINTKNETFQTHRVGDSSLISISKESVYYL
jgi:hypothetical protein